MGLDLALIARPASERALRGAILARRLQGGAVMVAGGFAGFLLMAHDGQLRFGVPMGALLMAACACGAMEVLGTFDDDRACCAQVAARDLARPAARTALCAAACVFSLWGAVHAVLPQAIAGGLLAASAIGLVASLFALGVALGPLRFDEDGRPRALVLRHGFWLFVVMALLDLPALGVGSLTDPWETHYGEVAREVLARDDWISLWWSWEGFFYSKPVLGIWMQSISMATLGVHVAPDRMLEGVAGRLAHPEWAVRAPFALFAMVGDYLLYKGVARWCGRRAGLLGAIALATSPHWFFIAHQSMTDMPFVAALSGAIGLVMLAVREPDTRLAASYEVTCGRLAVRLNLWHLVFGAVFVCVFAQILYLVSRNVELVLHASGPHGFRPHLDEVHAGSGLGNCDQPGNPACSIRPATGRFEPWMQALVWTGLLAVLAAACRRERRSKRLLYLGAWLLAALATMAKGPGGIAIPAACVLVWLSTTRRWRELLHTCTGAGALIVALVVGPWFVAEFVRHGSAFTDELIFHDMYSRAFEKVHDTNAGSDTSFVYYVQQLGYGLFPWTALAPVGLFAPLRKPDRADDARALLLLWWVVSFALFASMGTKFHHYILPAVPPAAILAGIALDTFFAKHGEADPHARAMLGVVAISGALVVALVARDLVAKTPDGRLDGPAHFMWLFTYRYDRPWPPSLHLRAPIVATAALAAALLVALAVPRARPIAAWAWVALAIGWAAWALDVYLPKASLHWGQRSVMDAYYTHRAGPQEPIVAYQMNWKGENFYTSNRIPQFGTPTTPPGTPALASWVREQRGKGTRVMYFVTEEPRVGGLKGEIQPKELHEVTTREDNNQFVLVRAEW
jgi:4-amino-4-deoxy-L-arabinose transferase-like glycosyltransferase